MEKENRERQGQRTQCIIAIRRKAVKPLFIIIACDINTVLLKEGVCMLCGGLLENIHLQSKSSACCQKKTKQKKLLFILSQYINCVFTGRTLKIFALWWSFRQDVPSMA